MARRCLAVAIYAVLRSRVVNRYDVELVRDGDDWRINHVVDNVWRSGDPAVLGIV